MALHREGRRWIDAVHRAGPCHHRRRRPRAPGPTGGVEAAPRRPRASDEGPVPWADRTLRRLRRRLRWARRRPRPPARRLRRPPGDRRAGPAFDRPHRPDGAEAPSWTRRRDHPPRRRV